MSAETIMVGVVPLPIAEWYCGVITYRDAQSPSSIAVNGNPFAELLVWPMVLHTIPWESGQWVRFRLEKQADESFLVLDIAVCEPMTEVVKATPPEGFLEGYILTFDDRNGSGWIRLLSSSQDVFFYGKSVVGIRSSLRPSFGRGTFAYVQLKAEHVHPRAQRVIVAPWLLSVDFERFVTWGTVQSFQRERIGWIGLLGNPGNRLPFLCKDWSGSSPMSLGKRVRFSILGFGGDRWAHKMSVVTGLETGAPAPLTVPPAFELGTVRTFGQKNAFGFIAPDVGGKDIFFCMRQVATTDGFHRVMPNVGQKVFFQRSASSFKQAPGEPPKIVADPVVLCIDPLDE